MQLQTSLGQGIARLAQAQVVLAGRAASRGQLADPRLGRGDPGTGGLGLGADLLVHLLRHMVALHQLGGAARLAVQLAGAAARGQEVGLGRGDGGIQFAVGALGFLQCQFGLAHGQSERLGIEAEQYFAGLHVAVVGHQHLGDLTADTRRDAHHRPGQLGLRGERHPQVGDQEVDEQQHEYRDSDLNPTGKSLIGSHRVRASNPAGMQSPQRGLNAGVGAAGMEPATRTTASG